jgi:hypothetical protein
MALDAAVPQKKAPALWTRYARSSSNLLICPLQPDGRRCPEAWPRARGPNLESSTSSNRTEAAVDDRMRHVVRDAT